MKRSNERKIKPINTYEYLYSLRLTPLPKVNKFYIYLIFKLHHVYIYKYIHTYKYIHLLSSFICIRFLITY